VGDVELGGGSLPAVRVELLPFALKTVTASSMEDVRCGLAGIQRQPAKGARLKTTVTAKAYVFKFTLWATALSMSSRRWTIRGLRRGLAAAVAAVRLQDLADVRDWG
jgi:multidrug efflux pump